MMEQKKWSEMTPKEKGKGCCGLIALAFVVFMVVSYILVTCVGSPQPKEKESEEQPKEVVYNSEWDGSVRQVKQFLKENLNDPDSYESMEWSPVSQNPHTKWFLVRHKYRAANGFGAKMIYNQQFTLDSLGNVINVSDWGE